MLTPEQAQAGLSALLGAGGLSGIAVAFFGFLTAARNGREPEHAPTITIGGPEGKSAEAAAVSLAAISTHLCRIAAILEIEADERWNGKDFRDRVDDRMLRFQMDDIKAAAGAYSTEKK